MGSAVAAKHEDKKSEAARHAPVPGEAQQFEQRDGAAAGLPLFLKGRVQTAPIAVNVPGDVFEQEADRVAESVTQNGAQGHPAAQVSLSPHHIAAGGSPAPAGEGAAIGGNPSHSELAARIQSPGYGRPLPQDLRSRMEGSLGADLSRVRIHDNAVDRGEADSLNAKAFTHGHDIWIGSTGSASDSKLMAHELTHVLQQTGGGAGVIRRQPATEEAAPAGAPAGEPAEAESSGEESPAADAARESHPSAEPAAEDAAASPERVSTAATPSSPEGESAAAPAASTAPEGPPAAPAAGDGLPAATSATRGEQGELDTSSHTGEEPAATLAAAPLSPADHGAAGPLDVISHEGRSADHAGTAGHDVTPDVGAVPTGDLAMEPVEQEPNAAFALPEGPAAANPPKAPTIQRDDNDDSLLGTIRRKINSIAGDLRGGWNRLTDSARSAFQFARDFVGGLVSGLGSLVSSALSVVRGAWSALSQQIQNLATSFLRAIKAGFSAVSGITAAIKDAILHLDASALRAAWGRLTGLVGGIARGIQAKLQALYQKITGLWQGLRKRFDDILKGLADQARAMFTRLKAAMNTIRDRLTSAWNTLTSRASELSSVLGGILDRLRNLLSRLLSWATDIWDGIRRQWNALNAGAGGVFSAIKERLKSAWDGLKKRASALWTRVSSLWVRLKKWVAAQAGRVISAVRSFWGRLSGFSIGGVIAKIEKYGHFVRVVQQAAEDPDSAMKPLVDGISKKLQAGMPAKAIEIGTQKLNETAGPRPASATGQPPVVVQRQAATASTTTPATTPATAAPASPAPTTGTPARTTDWGDVWAGFVMTIKYKWGLISIWQMVKDMLWSILWPWPSVWKELKGLWSDVKYVFGSFFAPRNPLTDFGGCLHDLYTDLLHLFELPLVLLRRIINIGLLLMGWVTLALVILGFIGGDIIGGIIGAIAGALAGVGIGAVPGGAGGAAVGGAAGAGIGFGVAMSIGQAFVFAYLITQGASVLKTILTLETGLQTEDEKDHDYGVLADGLIGLGVTLVLLGIGYLASRLAGVILGAIEGKFPSVSKFLTGLRSVRPPKVKGPVVDPDTDVPGRTTKEVPRLRDKIDPAVSPDGAFRFEDTWDTTGDETKVTTRVVHSSGAKGSMQHGINTKTGEVVYHYAFFDDNLPRWIQTDPPMVNEGGKTGTPLETYMTLRQLKMLSDRSGVPVAVTGPRVYRLSQIVNERTVTELAEATRGGADPNQAILDTHSVQYAKNSIVQSGGKIASASVDGGYRTEAGNVITKNPGLIAEHGLTPTTKVLYFFDIILNVVSADATVPPPSPGAPNLPPLPPPAVPVPQKDGGAD